MIKVNISPYEADRLELWQIAELMVPSEDSETSHEAQADDTLRERVRQLRAETDAQDEANPAAPEPEPDPDHQPTIFMAEPLS